MVADMVVHNHSRLALPHAKNVSLNAAEVVLKFKIIIKDPEPGEVDDLKDQVTPVGDDSLSGGL